MHHQTTVQSLPDEILSHVFMHHKPFRVNDVDITAWLSIPAVCRKWRALCLASPLYWTHILMPNPTYLRLVLERSREAPLVVFVNTETDDLECIAALQGHIYHTKYLNIRSVVGSVRWATAYQYIGNILRQPMPAMRGLHLHDYSESDSPHQLGALHGATLPSLPALHLLDIRGLRLDWETPRVAFGQLGSLHLEDLHLADMRGALTDMPNLREVAIKVRDPSPGDALPPAKSLVWPRLNSLELLCSPYAARAFWEALSAPEPAQLTWCIDQPSLDDIETISQYEELLRDVVHTRISHRTKQLHQARRLSALMLTASRTEISFNWSEDMLVHTSPNHTRETDTIPYTLSIKFILPFWPDSIRAVPLDGIQSLCIEEEHPWRTYYDNSGTYPAPILLPHLRDLRVLVLHTYRVNSPFLQHMATHSDELLLPHLEHIIIENTNLLTGAGNELLRYLKRRARSSRWLKELTIRKCTMSRDMVADLDTYVRLPVSWDYISTTVPL
ncbi:unnamed protein product [Peniophora sp. CBMAI 1063]|nr:unnamed protein product [Peniophora sp. CBMAI 1063]